MAFSIRIELVLALALGLSSVAWANSAEKRARAEAIEGKKAFDTQNYASAIKHYEAAYKLKPAPGLLFNLAQSHRRAHNFAEALSYFRRYLETNPPAAQAQATETVIAQVEEERRAFEEAARLEQERRERELAEQKAKEAEEQRLKLEATRLQAAQAEADAARRKLELEQALKAKSPAPIYTKWWFWGAIGVVAAGVGTSVAIATAPRPAPTTWPDINAR